MNNSFKEKWEKLLSKKRLREEDASEDIRSAFERDASRIIYSYPFRRMQDKTQVIPLPIIDFVHTRLTHSLEVASVGRSLGALVEDFLITKGEIEASEKGDIPNIIYAACLAHDIGNPPFGHSGEDSISDYFISGKGKDYIEKSDFSEVQKNDLKSFEGNALGFHLLNNYENNGLNLTCATLATFTKYPRLSYIEGDTKEKRWNNGISQKKYGFFYNDLKTFKDVAEETGLLKFEKGKDETDSEKIKENTWHRHPLAFLVEAADDICYRIIDLEDGFRIGKIPFSECEPPLKAIAEKDMKYWNEDKYKGKDSNKKKFSYLRSRVINKLIYDVVEVFKNKYENIMSGEFDEELLKKVDHSICDNIKQIKELVTKYVYKSHDVLSLEATGYEVLGGLVSEFIEASNICTDCSQKFESKKQQKYYDLLPDEYKCAGNHYERYLKICSYVAGMSDSYALNLYQKVKGIKV